MYLLPLNCTLKNGNGSKLYFISTKINYLVNSINKTKSIFCINLTCYFTTPKILFKHETKESIFNTTLPQNPILSLPFTGHVTLSNMITSLNSNVLLKIWKIISNLLVCLEVNVLRQKNF